MVIQVGVRRCEFSPKLCIYKEIWYAAEVIDHLLRNQQIDRAITMAMPPANHAYVHGSQELACV